MKLESRITYSLDCSFRYFVYLVFNIFIYEITLMAPVIISNPPSCDEGKRKIYLFGLEFCLQKPMIWMYNLEKTFLFGNRWLILYDCMQFP